MSRTIVHYLDSNTFGGCEESALQLLSGLANSGWQPCVFHHPEPGIERMRLQLKRADIACHFVPRISKRNMAHTLPQFVRKVRDVKPVVFHAHLNWPLGCGRGLLAARFARVPVTVATSHLYSPLTNVRFAKSKLRIHSRLVQRYIAVSHEVRGRICRDLRVSAAKVCVVHNGISLEPFSGPAKPESREYLAGEEGRPIVFTPARLHSQKGHIYLLRAAALVPNAVFVFAGDGPERNALLGCARDLGIEGRVRFLGQRSDIPSLLACCDLFVLPSLYEGLPISLLEAMAVGKPVIATAIGGTDEVVLDGQTGVLVPPANSEELANAIFRLLADPGAAARMAAAGRIRVKECFSSEAMAAGVSRVYHDLLEGVKCQDSNMGENSSSTDKGNAMSRNKDSSRF